MIEEEKIQRIHELVDKLNKASDAYYNGRMEIMSDHEWDELFDELKTLEEETGEILPSSPTQNVSEDNVEGKKEEHEFAALSLAKTKQVTELVKWAEEKINMQPTTEHVVDLNEKDPEKGLKAAEERLKAAGLPVTDENLFIAAACKDGNVDKGIDFLLGKGVVSVDKSANQKKAATSQSSSDGCTVTVNGTKYAVKLDGDKATVNGKSYTISVTDGIEETAKTLTY